jgi:Ca2+-binding RTX toxin-like protein
VPTVVGGSGSTAANSDLLVGIENFTGGSGGDTIIGTGGANILRGGGGNDTINGIGGNDQLFGDGGNDTFNFIIGGGADTIDGGTGADVLNITGLTNDDVLDVIYNGGALIVGFEGGTVTNVETINVNLGGNADTLSYAGSTVGVTVSLGNGNNISGTASGLSSVASILNVVGTAQTDSLTGNTGSNTLNGGGGIDTLNGGAGGDVLIGGDGADSLNTGTSNDNVIDIVRFNAVSEFGDIVINFDTNGPAGTDDEVEFGGQLNTNLDDGSNDNNFQFVTSNGTAAVQTVDVGDDNGDVEALLLTGIGGEGVTGANLGNAAAVAGAFNAAFNFTDAGTGADLVLVTNDTDGNSFSVWHWVQGAGGTGEIDTSELTRVGTFTANASVAANSFDFI